MASEKARILAVVAAGMMALAMAACSSSSKDAEPDANIFPKDYKLELMNTLQRELEDPTNIRDAFISEPFLTTASREQRYAVCVRSNSRNINRTYTGAKDRIGYFYAGHLNQLIEATADQCAKVAYKPWPELQNICFSEKGCK
jgi:hypothetical protein